MSQSRSTNDIDAIRPAGDYWKQYFDPDEIQEIEEATSTDVVPSGKYRLHVRRYLHGPSEPTVIVAHGMLGYGLAFARFQLPFYRAGFNVVQFDLPTMGQSSGRRGSCTVPDVMRAWRDMLAYGRTVTDGPLFVLGNAEDGNLGYYGSANQPQVAGMSLHTLFEYGDPAGVHWIGPPLVFKALRGVLSVVVRVWPTFGVKGTRTIPWPEVFVGPDDARYRELLEKDPLSLHRGEATLGYSVMERRLPPVRFEDCRTPVQLIASEASTIWPVDLLKRSHARLGGPKDLTILPGKPHWEMSREFHEMYCDHAIAWFRRCIAEWYPSEPATVPEHAAP